jgi:hypothetical protein
MVEEIGAGEKLFKSLKRQWKLARPERFELPTYCSGGNRSIQLSYGRDISSLHAGDEGSNWRTQAA